MLDLLVGFGHAFSVLLIALGIGILVWNISVLANALSKDRQVKVAVSPPAASRGSGSEGRVHIRDSARER